jgi:hypothetical protein
MGRISPDVAVKTAAGGEVAVALLEDAESGVGQDSFEVEGYTAHDKSTAWRGAGRYLRKAAKVMAAEN